MNFHPRTPEVSRSAGSIHVSMNSLPDVIREAAEPPPCGVAALLSFWLVLCIIRSDWHYALEYEGSSVTGRS